MPDAIVPETDSSNPSDSIPPAGNLTPAQRQFAEVLGSCLAEQWRRMQTAPQEDAQAPMGIECISGGS